MSGQVGDLEAELFVYDCLHRWLGVVDDVAQIAEAGDQSADVVLGELAGRLRAVPRAAIAPMAITKRDVGGHVIRDRYTLRAGNRVFERYRLRSGAHRHCSCWAQRRF